MHLAPGVTAQSAHSTHAADCWLVRDSRLIVTTCHSLAAPSPIPYLLYVTLEAGQERRLNARFKRWPCQGEEEGGKRGEVRVQASSHK